MSDREQAFKDIYPGSQGSIWYPEKQSLQKIKINPLLPYMKENDFITYCKWADIPDEWNEDLLKAAVVIANNKELSSLYSSATGLLIQNEADYDARLFKHWPEPLDSMGHLADMFFLLVSLECIPYIKEEHKKQNIPEQISRDSCGGIASKAKDFYFFNNRPGMKKQSIYWFRHYLKGELYRCGRLEFMLKNSDEDLYVYKNKNNNSVRIFHKEMSDKAWDCCLKPKDKVLDMHIPGGGALTIEAVKDSFKKALIFFDERSPGREIKGIVCTSWIFSPDLEKIYPEDSNLIKLKKSVHTYPVKSRDVEGIAFLLGADENHPELWKQKTSIQRNLIAHLSNGGKFRLAAMVLLRDELDSLE